MQHIGIQVAVTGAVVLLALIFTMPKRCPRMVVAVPVLLAYFSAWAALVGGFLWWVWA